jgi:DNA-binding MarR family transcriptional regulator
MRRDEDDLQLLAEVAGVLDQVVMDAGLSSGSYLLLRALAADEDGASITELAGRFGAEPDEVVTAAKALSAAGLADVEGTGVVATAVGRQAIEEIDSRGNEAIRAYVLDRPHSATVYGLMASMQAGRFTVEDLIEFLLESDDDADADGQGGDAA